MNEHYDDAGRLSQTLFGSVTRDLFRIGNDSVDAKIRKHTECARTRGSRTDRIVVRLHRLVQQPGQTEFHEFGLNRSFESDNYHIYVVEDS